MNRIIRTAVFFTVLLVIGVSYASADEFDSYVWFVDLEDRLYKEEPNSRTIETGYSVTGQVVVENADEDASRRFLENKTRDALRDWANETAEEKEDEAYTDCSINRYFESFSIEGMEYDGDCWWIDISGVLVNLYSE